MTCISGKVLEFKEFTKRKNASAKIVCNKHDDEHPCPVLVKPSVSMKIMLDRNLAKIHEVETKALKQTVNFDFLRIHPP